MRLSPVVPSSGNPLEFIEVDDRKIPASSFLTYEGVLLDEPHDSHVSGAIIEGSFVGTIRSKRSGVWHVEPAVRFDQSLGHARSIVYNENDVETDSDVARKKRDVDDNEAGISCAASKGSVRKRLAEIQEKATVIINN